LPLVSGRATAVGDGVLAKAEDANVVFCQLAPWQLHNPCDNCQQSECTPACHYYEKRQSNHNT